VEPVGHLFSSQNLEGEGTTTNPTGEAIYTLGFGDNELLTAKCEKETKTFEEPC